MPEGQGRGAVKAAALHKRIGPVCRQTLPEGDAPVSTAGQDPGVRRSLGLGAHAHVRVQAEAQQEAAQQGGVVLTVPLGRTDSDEFRSFGEFEM